MYLHAFHLLAKKKEGGALSNTISVFKEADQQCHVITAVLGTHIALIYTQFSLPTLHFPKTRL